MDLCHVDEAGFALTQPTTTSWGPVGSRLTIPYVAPQGRRLNVLGGYFSHGPQAGDFQFATFASLPKPRSKGAPAPETLARAAQAQRLEPADVGRIDSDVFLAFVWQLAGRPLDAPPTWKRVRPLVVVVDNYQVHKGERVRAEWAALQAADIHLFYLPAYSPELSRIEPLWKDVKYHELTRRSFELLGELKEEVERALLRKAIKLRATCAKTQE